MPKCKNDDTKRYKGSEPSPKGLGYCAHAEKEGTKKTGQDGNLWFVKKIKNGSLRWIKMNKTSTSQNKKKKQQSKIIKKYRHLNKSQLKTLYKIKKELKKELKKIDVKLFIINNKIRYGRFWSDYPWDVVMDKLDNFDQHKVLIVNLKLCEDNEIVLTDKGLYIQHSNIKYSIKKKVVTILKNLFGKNYSWNGKQSQAIHIKL